MTFADFFLICFIVGFSLSVIGALTGHIHVHVHIPHVHFGHGGVHLGHGPGHGGGAGTEGPPMLNVGTLVTFLFCFGGAGYILTRLSVWGMMVSVIVAILFGIAGAGLIFFFLSKLSRGKEEELDPADFEMVGVLGRISSPIRAGGTGEIIFSQAGSRRCSGARSEDAKAIPKGVEVIVTRFVKGIAYVRRWDEMTNS